ncbi:MAG: tetratricopeptide repeat protein, partial [Methanosarcinales archaeon]|nr:tetratricopeptide repeat protein [Methanosarcinales archaeon]
NYANLLQNLDNIDEAVIHHLKAIEADPNYAAAYSNYAILLKKLNKKDEAATHYKKAIDLEPKLAEAHGAYGLLLIDWDKRDYALSETESASDIFKETGRITQSYLAKAWFYEQYSEKYFKQKEYLKSSSDAGRASDEYFKAAETADENLMEYLTLQGNVLKAKYFMRKIPPKPWYDKIHRKFGKKSNISDFVYNLQSAAIWYQKASVCEVEGKKDVCTACHLSISVFSEVLDAMSAFISGNNTEITKDKWLNSLEGAGKTYADKELKTGIALVDSLKQLVKCADKLAEQKVIGFKIHEERLGKCYDNLTKVNENLGGVLGIISDHATEAIRNYAKKEGMVGFVVEENPKKSFFDGWLFKAIVVAILGIIGRIIIN